MTYLQAVETALETADSIAYDDCHKIYIHLDTVSTTDAAELGYTPIPVRDPAEAMKTIRAWYREACPLKFIQSIELSQDEKRFALEQRFAFENIVPQCSNWASA